MKKITILILLSALHFFCSLNCMAQKINSRPKSDENVGVIPFRFSNSGVKTPHIRIEINGKQVWAVFDTGYTSMCIMRQDIADKIGLKYDKLMSRKSINGVSMDCFISENQKYDIIGSEGQVVVQSKPGEVLILPNKYFDFAKNVSNDNDFGIFVNIGSAYDNYRVQLDYVGNVIRIIPLSVPLDTSRSVVADYEHDGLPWISVKNSKKQTFRTLIDTGAVWNEFPIEFDRSAYIVGTDRTSIGIGTISKGRLGKVSIFIGGFEFRDVKSLLYSEYNRSVSVLGSEFLCDKVITLDNKLKKAYVESLISNISENVSPFTGKIEGVFKVKLPDRDKKL